MNAPRTARERARVEITGEIVTAARAHLADEGPGGLSLRAVARDLGMASSAIYRYFPSRDALLTALIMEGYDALGQAVEHSEARVARLDLAGRWKAAGRAVRDWALMHPHEYALLYGSPVPGYAAPEATIDPATRVARVMVGVLVDLVAREDIGVTDRAPIGTDLAHEIIAGAGELAPTVPPALMARGVMAWIGLFGIVSFELFGHLVGTVEHDELLFEQFLEDSARELGLSTADR